MFTGKVYKGDFLHIVGEVQNSGSVNLEDFEIEAAYFDPNGLTIDAGPTHLERDPGLLRPGEKAPFMLILLDEEAGKRVASYELVLDFSATTEEPYELQILGDRAFVSKQGFYHVIGEVQNASQSNIESVRVYVTFYDESGTVIDIGFTFSGIIGLGTLTPGQKSPFDVYSGRADVKESVHSHSLHGEARVTDRVIYRQFQILNHESKVGILGDYIVEGTIKNIGDQDVKFVKVVGTFYGADKKLAAAASAFTDPRDLEAGEIGQFELSTYRYKFEYEVRPEDIESYDLAFECSTY